MATYSLQLTNINKNDIILYEKEHNVKIDDVVSDFLQGLLNKPKAKPTSKIDDAFGKYHQYAKNNSGIDDMNQSVADYFEKEWK